MNLEWEKKQFKKWFKHTFPKVPIIHYNEGKDFMLWGTTADAEPHPNTIWTGWLARAELEDSEEWQMRKAVEWQHAARRNIASLTKAFQNARCKDCGQLRKLHKGVEHKCPKRPVLTAEKGKPLEFKWV